jgi:hypothetical protein
VFPDYLRSGERAMRTFLMALREWFDDLMAQMVEFAEDDCPQACRGAEPCTWCGNDVVEDDAVVGGEVKP